MGANQSYVQAVPQPVQSGLAVFAPPGHSPHTYVAKQPVQLHVRENIASLTGDSFTVVDRQSGKLWYQVKGKLSFHQRKVLEDVAGVPVFTMKHKGLSLHATKQLWAGGTDSGAPVLEARQQITYVSMYKQCTIAATTRDLLSGKTVHITLLGDVRGKSGVILLGDESSRHVIAKMYKPTTATSFLSGQQEYEVDVAAGVDTALITAMCVMWDEAVHDGNSGTSIF